MTDGFGCDEPFSSTNVNQLFALGAVVSPFVSVTVTWYRPAPSVWSFGGVTSAASGGNSASIVVGLVTFTNAEGTTKLPTATLATWGTPLSSKLLPVIVTSVLLFVGPNPGETLLIVGLVMEGASSHR